MHPPPFNVVYNLRDIGQAIVVFHIVSGVGGKGGLNGIVFVTWHVICRECRRWFCPGL